MNRASPPTPRTLAYFGQRIGPRRTYGGPTQAFVRRRLGWSKARISKALSGARPLSLRDVVAISKAAVFLPEETNEAAQLWICDVLGLAPEDVRLELRLGVVGSNDGPGS